MRKKVNIRLVILLGLLSVFALPSSFAILKSYASSSKSLVSSIWSVSLEQTGVNNNISVIEGGSAQNYTLNVKSLSEVDVIYTIVLSNIPSGVEVKLDNGQFQTPTNNTVTFTDAGTILYSDVNKTKTHTIAFKANSGTALVNNQIVGVDVTVRQMTVS